MKRDDIKNRTLICTVLLLKFICIIFYGCQSPTAQTNEKKFFEYDTIEHYHIDFDESDLEKLIDDKSNSEIDSFKLGILIQNVPNSITDLTFIDKLTEVGYSKTLIDKSNFDSIDEIFAEKQSTENESYGCIYIYRDILIFKKEGNVIGTSKVCFQCMGYQIKGTMANTENFGQDGDFEKLEKLLKK